MSAYIYALIPYQSELFINLPKTDPYPCVFFPAIPELKDVDSELADREGLHLFADFLLINTCHRDFEFANSPDGRSYLREEVYKIARALGAKEVWYAEELATDEMFDDDFSFSDWVQRIEGKQYSAELSIETLKGNHVYSYYHDDFFDIILE